MRCFGNHDAQVFMTLRIATLPPCLEETLFQRTQQRRRLKNAAHADEFADHNLASRRRLNGVIAPEDSSQQGHQGIERYRQRHSQKPVKQDALPESHEEVGSLAAKELQERVLNHLRARPMRSPTATRKQPASSTRPRLLWVSELPKTTNATPQAHWIGSESSRRSEEHTSELQSLRQL